MTFSTTKPYQCLSVDKQVLHEGTYQSCLNFQSDCEEHVDVLPTSEESDILDEFEPDYNYQD